MTITDMSAMDAKKYIVDRIGKDLLELGYQRMGRSSIFYEYYNNKTAGKIISVYNSRFNCFDDVEFCFECACGTILDYNMISPYKKTKLTTKALREMIQSPLGWRSGEICYNRDYWYELDSYDVFPFELISLEVDGEKVVLPEGSCHNKRCTAKEYYDNIILRDLRKIDDFLNGQLMYQPCQS